MRRVAPEIDGSAASMNSWSLLKAKPTLFRRTVTVLHTIHTEKARSSAGIDIHRLRVAMFLPDAAQNSASSGRQSISSGPRAVFSWLLAIMPMTALPQLLAVRDLGKSTSSAAARPSMRRCCLIA
ncbi:hypothetical protein D3C76_1279980 [compost metagenome]